MNFQEKIIKELISKRIKNSFELNDAKRKIAKKFKISIPSNFWLLQVYQKLLHEKKIKKSRRLEKILKVRPIRSLSGIVNVSVLTKPYFCPGKCIFCPAEEKFPKSYVSGEPAAERARFLNYDPYLQVRKRLEMLKTEGHATDKIELRIVGGTFSFYPLKYRIFFIKECFRAANEFEKLNIFEKRKKKEKDTNGLWEELFKEQKRNEKAKNKIVGISVETRPDFVKETELKILRQMGITLVEIGVQSIFDDVLRKNQTGLNAKIIAEATRLLKDSGFKVLYHLMLGLPGSNPEKDLECFKTVFSDEKFLPDWLKIYPLVITKNSPLYKKWKGGEYKPYSEKTLIKLLIEIKKNLPYWVRVARVLRDIPSSKIETGCKISNIREIVQEETKKRGLVCKCIRCREIKEKYNPKEKIYLFREDYNSAGGKEIFLSFENKNRDKLYSMLRLRIPSFIFDKKEPIFPVLKDSALIREIQTYGELVPVGFRKIAPQHTGLGKKLIEDAEKITKREFKLKKIAIISGVGAREYFKKKGYKLKQTYMVKTLS